MEVEGKGKEKLVANNEANDTNDHLEKLEEYNSEAEAEAAKNDEMNHVDRN